MSERGGLRKRKHVTHIFFSFQCIVHEHMRYDQKQYGACSLEAQLLFPDHSLEDAFWLLVLWALQFHHGPQTCAGRKFGSKLTWNECEYEYGLCNMDTVGLNKGRMSTLKSWEIGGENIQSKWVEVCCLPECHDAQAQSTLKILFFFGCAKKVLILLDGFSFLKLCPLPKTEMKWKSSRRSAFFTGGDPTPAAKALLLRDLRRDAVLNTV